MTKLRMLAVVVMLCALASAANAALFQDNFNDAAWTQAHWLYGNTLYGQTYTFVDDGGNQVLRLVSGPSSPAAGPEAAASCNSGQTYFVDNMSMQVDINIRSGGGGGIVWGFEGAVGNEYYLTVSPSAQLIQISEEPYASGHSMVGNAPWPVQYNTWYTVKVVSTGTNFQMYFGERGQPLTLLFDVPQDQNHYGFQSHVRGQCGVYAENNVAPGASDVWFDNFVFDALQTPPEQVFQDNFESSAWTLSNWVQALSPVVTFESSGGSQAVRVTAPVGGDTCGMLAGNGQMYFTDAFTLRTAAYVDAGFKGGISFGAAATGVTPEVFSDYFVGMKRVTGGIYLEFVEELNNVHSLLGSATVSAPTVDWYNFEVVAGVPPALTGSAIYRIWVWPRTNPPTPKPADPVISVRQDQLHTGYRLINMGAVSLWQDPGGSALYDDFYLQATPVPATNTQTGANVPVTTPEGVGLTFTNVDSPGTTEVETSTTGPGPGPGNFQIETTGLYYDINTSCTFTGDITVCIPYDPAISNPASLVLLHYDTQATPPDWVPVANKWVDTNNHTICGTVSHLSVFVIGAGPRFEGFLPPINMPPQEQSVFKAGSTIPVKFRLRTFFTQQIIDNATATIAVQYLGDDQAAVAVNETFTQALGDSGNTFRYDATEQQYIFNLKTKGLLPGIYRIHASAYGGSLDNWVDVRLKK